MKPEPSASELRVSAQILRPHLRVAFVFAMVAALLVLAPTFYMFEVYERVINSRSQVTLAMLTLVVLFLIGIMELLHWSQGQVMLEASRQWDEALSEGLVRRVYEMNLRRGQGASVQPLNDWRSVRDFLLSPFVAAVLESPVALVFLFLLFLLNPLLCWVALGAASLQALLAWLNERATQPPLSEANRLGIDAQQYADNSLRHAEVVEAMGMLGGIHQRWSQRQMAMLALQARASDKAAGYQTAMKVLQMVVSSMLLGLAAWLVMRDALAGGEGMLIVASVLGGRVLAPSVQAIGQWRSVVNVREAWRRLDELLTKYPLHKDGMPLPPPQGRLTVEALVAGAPSSPGASSVPILRNVQFALAPGQMLAVIGPSASGKSTLARLLVGLWPALQGKVRLDGADVFSWNKSELGPHIGYLPQGVDLMEGTVAENIARFGEPDSQRLWKAIDVVGLRAFVEGLPQGVETSLGGDGVRLSGGQRQRMALARALYGQPRLIVLDEPNASLDDDGDRALLSALDDAKAWGASLVVITHRTNVLSLVDHILVLRDGQQQAFGPRDEILAALKQANSQTRKPAVVIPPATATQGPATGGGA